MAFKMRGYSAFTKSPDVESLSSFEQAFAAARNAGKKTFTWEGKSYHTKTKEEVISESARKAIAGGMMGAAMAGVPPPRKKTERTEEE